MQETKQQPKCPTWDALLRTVFPTLSEHELLNLFRPQSGDVHA